MKKMAMLLVAGCTIGMLTGCGIPEEDHNAIIEGINTKNQEAVDKLNITIADKDDVIKSHQEKARQTLIRLDDDAERINDLQQKSAETSKALKAEESKVATLESQLKTSKSRTAAAKDDAMAAENKYSTLDVEYQDLKRRFEMFQKNMSALSAPTKEVVSPIAQEEGPKTDAQRASSLLDQMGTL